MVRTTPTITGTISDRRGDHHARAGQLEAEGLHQRPQPGGQADADERAHDRRDQKPVNAASPSTDRRTCFRLAPRARSSASSRVRWATTIVKVLTMMNPPTTSAINAKAVSAVSTVARSSAGVGRPLGRPLGGRLHDGAGADGGRDPRARARRG